MPHTARTIAVASVATSAALVLATCKPAPHAGSPPGATAVLFEGMGATNHEITTGTPRAQRFFDQGLVLAWGFNHREAQRSFLEAARLDSACAMCYWGAAWVLGPNINAKMDPADAPEAWTLLQKAVALEDRASDRERAYIDALRRRYAEHPPEDRAALDAGFADGMRDVVRRFPDDLDAQAMLAEAIMDQHPWDYWDLKTRKARPWTAEILSLLRGVMRSNPNQVLANHLYIHAVEASPHPELGEPAADRLGPLVPGAGHLVHMPAHIYLRVGRYADASAANEAAVQADQAYLAQSHAGGAYPLLYVPHNWHFLWMTATLEGRSARAIEAARQVQRLVPLDSLGERGWGALQHYLVLPLYAYARFGKWQEILDAPRPDGRYAYPTAVWHYTRGLALLSTGELDAARRERDALERLMQAHKTDLTRTTLWDINTSYALMRIADRVLGGEIAARQHDYRSAIRLLTQADDLEMSLAYDEPPDWYYPVRHSLGAVYLEANQPAQAERLYRADLDWYPENGFALFGLEWALRAQGKRQAAAEVHARFETAWVRADHALTSSRY